MSLLGKKALDVAANLGRRRFLNSAAALGAVTVGLAACKENTQGSAASAPAAPVKTWPAPSHGGQPRLRGITGKTLYPIGGKTIAGHRLWARLTQRRQGLPRSTPTLRQLGNRRGRPQHRKKFQP